MQKILTLFIYVFILVSCAGSGNNATDDAGKTVEMRYAELLAMHEGDGFIKVEIRNPWDSTAILHRYVLVPADRQLPKGLPEGDIVRIPLANTAVYTSVHCGLIDELGATDAIRGVCDLQYIYLPEVHKRVRDGSITDLGNSMTPNIEKLIDLQPDAMFISPFENSGSYGKLGKLKIPIIECADYMETSPMGRAEWIRFYGILLGKRHEADSIFSAVEKNYNDIKDMAARQKERPTVVTEMKIGSTWYVAGNNSTVGILIKDAGGDYIFKDVASKGAVPYSPEQVFVKAQKAGFWLIKYNQTTDMTMEELADAWASNRYLEAYRNGNVYGCNLAKTRFYEETPFHPDIILAEYASILHPGMAGNRSLRYYKKLQPAI